MDTNSESISLHSLSVPLSLRSATKEKFEDLLKNAQKQKKNYSNQKLVNEIESTTASSENLLDTEDNINVDHMNTVDNASKGYLLNKFLSDSSQNLNEKQVNTVIFKIPPIPKPRKKNLEQRRGSNSSAQTYHVTSPKINKDVQEKIASSTMYKIENEITTDRNFKEIGDVVLHNSPTTSKVSVYAENHDILEKADIESLSDTGSNIYKSSSNSGSKKQNIKPIEVSNEEYVEISETNSPKGLGENSVVLEKPKAKKRTKKEPVITETQIQDDPQDAENQSNNTYDYRDIVEIVIHKTDRLKQNPYVLHPVVKVHIVNVKTGEYYKKSDQNRSVVFYYENDNSYILPVMTSYYNLQQKRSFFPNWEETILLNEAFDYLITENVILFFEVLDFASTSMTTSSRSINKKMDKGWFRIAFAFLRPIGKNNHSNVNKKLRLQLYHPGNIPTTKPNTHKCYVWYWWQKKTLKKYPSTLYVTIKKIVSPKKVIQTFRSKTPLQQEHIAKGNTDVRNDLENSRINTENFNKTSWGVNNKKKYKLPNKCVAKLDSYDEGCFLTKFSNNGLYLGCVVKIGEEFSVVIFETKNFEEYTRFTSHQGLIYSINWSKDDSLLVTASADNTAAVWNFAEKLFLQILPHPSFVYASDINAENVIATGCFDNIVRIWCYNIKNKSYNLLQELESHTGYVTSVCFSKKTPDSLFSADSVGKIIQWHKHKNEWEYNRHIQIFELTSTIINQILLFPHEKRMLVHARDSSLRIISINNSCVLYWLRGALSTRVQTYCSISPRGDYIICGSENGLVMVWNAKTGKDVHTYYAYTSTIHSVEFHPKEDMLTICHYGSNLPILVYAYSETEANVEKPVDNGSEEGQFKGCDEKVCESRAGALGRKLDFQQILQKMDTMLHL